MLLPFCLFCGLNVLNTNAGWEEGSGSWALRPAVRAALFVSGYQDPAGNRCCHRGPEGIPSIFPPSLSSFLLSTSFLSLFSSSRDGTQGPKQADAPTVEPHRHPDRAHMIQCICCRIILPASAVVSPPLCTMQGELFSPELDTVRPT